MKWPNDRHFSKIRLIASLDNDSSLEENVFGDITFDEFVGTNITKIHTNAFNKTAEKITLFDCSGCNLNNLLPNYDIRKMANQMYQLKYFFIRMNVPNIPTHFIEPINDHKSKLFYISIGSPQNWTIWPRAFENLNDIVLIQFSRTTINRFEKGAFKFYNKSVDPVYGFQIGFYKCDVNGEIFQNGSFDGLEKIDTAVQFYDSDIDYLSEQAFSSLLDNRSSFITMSMPVIEVNSKIQCLNCKNYWIIKQHRNVQQAYCKENPQVILFDDEIQQKFNQKCRWFIINYNY